MNFVMLGPLEVVTAAGVANVGGRRVRTTMAILLLNRNLYVPLDKLIEEVWAERPPRSAIENIRTYVYQLRSALLKALGHDPLETVPGGYRFNVRDGDVDADRYFKLSEEGQSALAAGRALDASILLANALRLWHGPPMAGLEMGPSASVKLVSLEEHHLKTQLSYLHAAIDTGRGRDVIGELLEVLGDRPYDEGVWLLLMRALAQTGRRGEALQTYGRARRLLTEELGVEPGPALRELHQSILQS